MYHEGNERQEAQLEAEADALLAQAGRDPEYPAYTEAMLRQKIQRAGQRDLRRASRHGLASATAMENILSQLRRAEIELVFRSSKLTPRERHVCRCVAQEQTYVQIADALGCSPQAVGQVVARARAKIAARWRIMPYRGLWKLYAEDIHRVIYVK